MTKTRPRADLLQQYEARIAALERLVGRQALELEFVKGAVRSVLRPKSANIRPSLSAPGFSIAEGCRLIGIARSTFHDLPTAVHDDTAIMEAIAAICDEFEFYGCRRVRAELRHRGMIVNHKKVRRLMREHDLQPRRRRRHVATTDSNQISRSIPIEPES